MLRCVSTFGALIVEGLSNAPVRLSCFDRGASYARGAETVAWVFFSGERDGGPRKRLSSKRAHVSARMWPPPCCYRIWAHQRSSAIRNVCWQHLIARLHRSFVGDGPHIRARHKKIVQYDGASLSSPSPILSATDLWVPHRRARPPCSGSRTLSLGNLRGLSLRHRPQRSFSGAPFHHPSSARRPLAHLQLSRGCSEVAKAVGRGHSECALRLTCASLRARVAWVWRLRQRSW